MIVSERSRPPQRGTHSHCVLRVPHGPPLRVASSSATSYSRPTATPTLRAQSAAPPNSRSLAPRSSPSRPPWYLPAARCGSSPECSPTTAATRGLRSALHLGQPVPLL